MCSPVLVLTGLLLATAPPLSVPDPAHCSVPAFIVFCPDGDLSPEIVVRDFGSVPIAGSQVVLDFSICPPSVCARPFPAGVTNPTYDQATHGVVGLTDANGRLSIPLALGGSCTPQAMPLAINVYADGVPLAAGLLESPDQNGDLVVDASDLAILDEKLAHPLESSSRTADLNGDGTIDAADRTFLRAHMGHACDVPTPVRHSSWGDLKILYR